MSKKNENFKPILNYASNLKKKGFTREAIVQCLDVKFPFSFEISEHGEKFVIAANHSKRADIFLNIGSV